MRNFQAQVLSLKKKTREGKKHWKAAAPKQVRHLLERQYQEHDFTPIPNHKALVYSNTTCLHLPTDCNLHILGGCSKSRTWHGQFTRHTQRNKQHTESASAFSTVYPTIPPWERTISIVAAWNSERRATCQFGHPRPTTCCTHIQTLAEQVAVIRNQILTQKCRCQDNEVLAPQTTRRKYWDSNSKYQTSLEFGDVAGSCVLAHWPIPMMV
jgi:hypothetical protein